MPAVVGIGIIQTAPVSMRATQLPKQLYYHSKELVRYCTLCKSYKSCVGVCTLNRLPVGSARFLTVARAFPKNAFSL
jgi:hypothetical protein